MEKYIIKINFERSDFDDNDFIFGVDKIIYQHFVKQLYNCFTSVSVIYIENNDEITKKFKSLAEAIHHIKKVNVSGSLIFRCYKVDDESFEHWMNRSEVSQLL